MPRITHFLVFSVRAGITVTNAMLHEGQLTDVSGFRMFVEGGSVYTLNEVQLDAMVGILRHLKNASAHFDEAIFYDGNWWAATHAGNELGGCAKVIRRVRLAA